MSVRSAQSPLPAKTGDRAVLSDMQPRPISFGSSSGDSRAAPALFPASRGHLGHCNTPSRAKNLEEVAPPKRKLGASASPGFRNVSRFQQECFSVFLISTAPASFPPPAAPPQ